MFSGRGGLDIEGAVVTGRVVAGPGGDVVGLGGGEIPDMKVVAVDEGETLGGRVAGSGRITTALTVDDAAPDVTVRTVTTEALRSVGVAVGRATVGVFEERGGGPDGVGV
jgi:hypothetical protein